MNQIQFDDISNYDDWGIYLSSFTVGDAEPKENFIDIPMGDGSLDLTESVNGEVNYNDRSFEAIFTLKPPRSNWNNILTLIRAFLNGKKRVIRIPDDSDHYLIGRCKTSFSKDNLFGTLTVTATCEPWFYKNDITTRTITIPSGGESNITLKNSRRRVVPTITNSAEVTFNYRGNTRTVGAGTHRLTSIVLEDGDNPIRITGTSGTTVKFEYQEGVL